MVDVYGISQMPTALLTEHTGNTQKAERKSESGEVFQDMAAIVPCPAEADSTIATQYLVDDRNLTVSEYLQSSCEGDKCQIDQGVPIASEHLHRP